MVGLNFFKTFKIENKLTVNKSNGSKTHFGFDNAMTKKHYFISMLQLEKFHFQLKHPLLLFLRGVVFCICGKVSDMVM